MNISEKQQIQELIDLKFTRKQIAKKLNITFDSLAYKIKKYKLSYNRHLINVKEKKCSDCNKVKNINQFYKNKKKSYHSYCKLCITQQTIERQRLIKKQAVKYKGGSCVKCGYFKCLGALQFHHVAEKSSKWTNFKMRTFDESFKKELDKCILLCANCHAEEHTNYCDF